MSQKVHPKRYISYSAGPRLTEQKSPRMSEIKEGNLVVTAAWKYKVTTASMYIVES